MDIEIANRQTCVQIRIPSLRRLVAGLLQEVQRTMKGSEWRSLSILLTDDSGIADVNRRYFLKCEPTDVISFRYVAPGAAAAFDGELVVNAQCAASEGRRRGGLERELALYIAHGCNHLTGENDDTPRRRARMRRRELRWLSRSPVLSPRRPLRLGPEPGRRFPASTLRQNGLATRRKRRAGKKAPSG